jgi:hypothetical protein
MNGEAMWVIEKYLQLVREYLDESIADDIIGEIRVYLVEAAEDLSQGEISVEAAKKVVAGFGAPSEVAKEYSSLTTDESETKKEPSEEFLVQLQKNQQTPVVQPETQKPPTREVSYFATYTKALTLIVSWMTISWTLATMLAPWWTRNGGIIFPIVQFCVLVSIIIFMLEETRKKGIQLEDRSYPQWSGLQKLVTFPENLPFNPSENTRMLDIMLTVFGAGFFAVSFLGLNESYTGWLFIGFFTTIILIARSIILIRELGGIDPSRFVKQEYVLDAITMVFLNSTISWLTSPYSLPSPFGILLWMYAFGFSINILYQLVIKGQEMWGITMDSSLTEEQKPLKKTESQPSRKDKVYSTALLAKTKKLAKQSLKKITAIYIAMPLIGFVITIFSGIQLNFDFWNMFGIAIIIDIVFWLLAIGFCAGYFGVRYYLIKSHGRTEIIPKRSRKESFIDLIATVLGLIVAVLMVTSLHYFLIADFIDWMQYNSFQSTLIVSTELACLILFLFIGIIARAASDLVNLIKRETKFSLKSLAFSGNCFILATVSLFGLSFVAHDIVSYHFYAFYFWANLIMLALAALVVVSFQTITSRIKLDLIKKESEVDIGGSIEIA